MRTPALLVLILGLAGCASSTRPASEPEPVIACQVPVAPAAAERWQQISADGFTFCVPASWRASSGNTVRGGDGWIRWGTGEIPRTTRTIVVTVPAGQMPQPPGRLQRFSEFIGGGVAELWENELEGTFYTGAQWRSPRRAYVLGQGSSQGARALQLQIYRTVRFTGQ